MTTFNCDTWNKKGWLFLNVLNILVRFNFTKLPMSVTWGWIRGKGSQLVTPGFTANEKRVLRPGGLNLETRDPINVTPPQHFTDGSPFLFSFHSLSNFSYRSLKQTLSPLIFNICLFLNSPPILLLNQSFCSAAIGIIFFYILFIYMNLVHAGWSESPGSQGPQRR